MPVRRRAVRATEPIACTVVVCAEVISYSYRRVGDDRGQWSVCRSADTRETVLVRCRANCYRL